MEASDRRGAGTAGGGGQLCRLPASLWRISVSGRLALPLRRPDNTYCRSATHHHRPLLPAGGRRCRHAEAAALQPLRRSAQHESFGKSAGSRRGRHPLLATVGQQLALFTEQLLPKCGGRRFAAEWCCSATATATVNAAASNGGCR